MAVSEWDRRELCPDGSCTGLIGPEGTCKVCGRAAPNWGDERKRGTVDNDEDDDEIDDDEDSADPVAPATPVAIGGGAWQARQLCIDGACVGVIGDDGKCKVCGKAAGPAVARRDIEEDDDADDSDDDADDADDDDETAARDEDDGDEDDGDDADDDDDDETAARDDEDEDEEDEEEDDDEDEESDKAAADGDHNDLAAAAAQLAGVASSAEVADADRLAGASKSDEAPKPAAKPKAKKAKSDDDGDRQLCPDGGCIGVIGPDGKCKVCGKEAAA